MENSHYVRTWPNPSKIEKRIVALSEYIEIIKKFIEHRMLLNEFETAYITLSYADQSVHSEEEYDALGTLFSDIECYDPNCLPGQETAFEISEPELYRLATVALEKLKAITAL